MGLDAFVHCRCWQDGRAAPPPCAPDLIGFDEEGWLSLDLPYEDNEETHHAFDAWQRSGCPHGMRHANEWVSNWGGYRMFQAALGQAGWQHFPTMRAELPNANGGQTSAAAAARMLAELDYFDRHAALAGDVVLRDEATGRVLLEHIAAYDGITMLGPGYRAGVDADGFFVLAPDTRVTLFRSMRFRQRVLGERGVEFTDAADAAGAAGAAGGVDAGGEAGGGGGAGVTVVAMPPVGAQPGEPVPERLRVESRPRTAADYARIVGVLRTLCRSAVETGNPIVWT